MSLSVHEILVGDQSFTLRLTSKALANFNLKHGSDGTSPVVAVLNAVNDYAARIDLFTNALNHPENKNSVKDGALLLDMMADSDSWDRCRINDLILDLSVQSGLITEMDRAELVAPVAESGTRLLSALAKLLVGDNVSGGGQTAEGGEPVENPI